MPAISVGSVEVDVLPNAQGFQGRMRAAVLPSANLVGDEVGRVIGRHIAAQTAQAIRDGVTAGGRTAQAPAARQGAQTGSSFGRGLRTAVAAAIRDLPEITLDADSSPAQREIAQIRAQMQTLMDVEVGVDIDAGEALARLSQMQARLQRLAASDVDVDVRLDVSAASAQLAAFQAQVARLDGQTARVDVDTRSAAANFNLLTTAALTFGPAILPVLPIVAAGLGAVAAAGTAAAVGVGAVALVAVPAFKQIGTVLQAQKSAQDAATNATYQGGQASSQAASRSMQLASAQAAVASAERSGAKQIAQAQAQVSQARRSAAQTAAQASLRAQQAARAVEDAEESLADAQRDARRAQEDLTAARRTAAQELEDLNSRLAGAQLSQRDAEIALKEAAIERDKVLKNAKSTDLDKQKALLQYDQAVQRLKEQTTETARLKAETADANKKGVEGSDTVRNAQDRLAESQESVADRARALTDAQAEQSRTATQNAQDMADAQRRIADAQTGVADAQVQAAEGAAAAQRQLAQASQSAAGGVDAAATAQAKYQAELDKLTPSARDTFNSFVDLRSAFGDWSRSLQPKVMPLFTRALNGMRRALPSLTPFVIEAADAIGDLQDRASRGFKSPWWKTFKKDLQGSVKPAITGLGVAFGNIFKGMTGVIGAFLPRVDDVSGSMQRMTGRFAKWGTSLKGSPAFEKFLDYTKTNGPIVGETLGEVASAFFSVSKALAPVSGPLLRVLGIVADFIGTVADKAPLLVIGLWGVIVAWKVWTGVMWLWAAALAASGWTLLVIGLAALAAAVVYCWKKFPGFREAVMKAWEGIKTASLYVWNAALKPFFKWFGTIVVWLWQRIIKPYIGFLIAYWKTVADVAVWLWKKVLGPAFRGIGSIISWWWTNIVKRYFGFVRGAISVLADAFRWLYNKAIKPAWNSISSVISGVWTRGIKPAFNAVKTAVGKVADAFELARKAVKTAWEKIKGITKAPVDFVINTIYNKGIVGVWNKVADAFGAKPLLKEFHPKGFASGGVLPGYTPGRDVHDFVSPTGGRLALSGGEAIMRPEFTRAVGSGFVGAMNSIAKSRGAQGVKAALAPVFGGNPDTPTQRFADGGIFDWIGKGANKVAGVGSAAWDKVKEGASWLKDSLAGSARAGVENVVNPLLKSFPGMDTGFGKMIRKIPGRLIDALFGYSSGADKKGAGGGTGGPKIQAALRWAKAQAGKPYIWGGAGPRGFDCSGFMGSIENVIRGEKPNRRRWATGAFSGKTAPPGWRLREKSPFMVGITNAGVGHTAGTLGGVHVESRGGEGVVVGKRARGYNSGLFNSWYGFRPGSYDAGGYLQPGLNLAYNGTGRPEPVFTSRQANALTSMAARGVDGGGVGDLHVQVYVGDREITDIARAEVYRSNGELLTALNARPTRR